MELGSLELLDDELDVVLDEVDELLVDTEVEEDVEVLSSLDVVLIILSKELILEEDETAPTLHEEITKAVNNVNALRTCLFFITH